MLLQQRLRQRSANRLMRSQQELSQHEYEINRISSAVPSKAFPFQRVPRMNHFCVEIPCARKIVKRLELAARDTQSAVQVSVNHTFLFGGSNRFGFVCLDKCYCNSGYVRALDGGQCVSNDQCPIINSGNNRIN